MNKDETGKGVSTEVIKALVGELSHEAEVRAYCHPENYAAHSVARKCGFMPMGINKHKNFGNEGEMFLYKRKSAF